MYSPKFDEMDFDNEILPLKDQMMETYGFTSEEVNFIVRQRPATLLQEDHKGIKPIFAYLKEERDFNDEQARSLILRYPAILSKERKHFEDYFSLLQENGISQEEATSLLIQYPKILI